MTTPNEEATEEQGRRIDKLEASGEVDRQMIDELRAHRILTNEHAEQPEQGLWPSRLIGAAMGILMTNRRSARKSRSKC